MPTLQPIITEIMTAKVVIYAVIRARSHQGVKAMKAISAVTTRAERRPPTM
jgi:hypothetical protein